MTKAAFGGRLTPSDSQPQIKDSYNRAALKNPKTTPLHRLSLWSYLTSRQWQQFVAAILSHVQPPLKDGDSVFESGCGVGALLEEVRRLHPTVSLAGVDLAENAVAVARQVLDGDFDVGDGRKLRGRQANSYDLVISNGVLGLVDSLADADKFVQEMVRVAKPGAAVCVATLIEPQGKFHGLLRLPIPKNWWRENAERWGVDHVDIKLMGKWKHCWHQRDRYAVYMRKNPAPGGSRNTGRARGRRDA